MAYEISAPNTGDSLNTLDSDSLRKLWKRQVYVHEQEQDFFSQFEGNREDSLIETVTDTAVGAGQRITFTSMAGFYQEGKHGEENFETTADFEPAKIDSNTLYVDWMRNGTRWSRRMESFMGLKNEIANKFPVELGKWEGRKKNRAMWMMFREQGASDNYAVAGGGTDINELSGTNVLSWNDCVEVGTLLQNKGARPAHLATINKVDIHRYVIAAGTTGLASLKTDDQYIAALSDAGIRGSANELFTGGFADVDGHMVRRYQDIDHDGDGPIGSPINPKLRLGAAITAGTASFTISGGSNAKVLYTADFPNHAFKFNASVSLSTDTEPFYLLVVNPSNAATDPGKMGFYKCVGNTGYAITVTQRLAGTIGGAAAHTTVGDVTWNTGVWAGLHTDTHPAGAMAYLANSKGQPYGWTLFMGACAARRGYGEYRNHRATDQKEAGFYNESYIWTVFGQVPKMDAAGRFPGFMMLAHSLHYPGTPIPRNIT